MRKAARIVATALGIFAAIGGLEHGYFEVLQGHVRPESLMIASIGPPCDPERVWHACEPAMTIVPSFLVSGILTLIFSLILLVWSPAFVHRKRGGLVQILLSIGLLLVGGGIFPPVIGIIGGAIGTRINVPVTRRPASVSRFLARLWPWPLILFFSWALLQFPVGYLFNEFMMTTGFFVPLLILGLMVLTILSALAYDATAAGGAAQ